jgi:hypothetical protein
VLKQRIDYWSCSRFADWVRGEKKPHALEWDEWDEWNDAASKKRPVRFFLAEKGLNTLQNVFMFPFDLWRTIRNKIRLRFFDRPYCLDTGLSKWEWHELDERIIHGLFNALKDYVEVELASMFLSTDIGEFKMKGGRCPEAGIANLEWQSGLKYGDSYFVEKGDPMWGKPTPQAVSARKILKLYRWWLARSERPDPMKVSGWSDVWESKDENKKSKASKSLSEIEDEYDREDEKMLIRLIRLRRSLWT